MTTTGGSALEAVDAVHAFGASAVLVITIIDRLEGAGAAFRARDLPFVALFTSAVAPTPGIGRNS